MNRRSTALDQDPRARAAVLPGVVEHRVRSRGRRLLEVASAKTMLALLPPSSRVTGLTCARAPGHHPLSDLGRAGEDDLRDVGVVDEALPDDAALAGQHLEHVLGDARLQGQFGEPDRGQRREFGRLEHHGVAGRQRRRERPTTRSASGSSTARSRRRHPAARGTSRRCRRRPGSAGRSAVPARRSSTRSRRGRCRPPSARCRSVWPELATSSWPGPRGRRRRPRRSAQQPGAVAGRDRAPGGNARRGAGDRVVGAARSNRSTVVTGSSVAGLITVVRGHASALPAHIRSKLRTRSQSVTAASKAANSTRALLA